MKNFTYLVSLCLRKQVSDTAIDGWPQFECNFNVFADIISPYGSHCIDMTPSPEPINSTTGTWLSCFTNITEFMDPSISILLGCWDTTIYPIASCPLRYGTVKLTDTTPLQNTAKLEICVHFLECTADLQRYQTVKKISGIFLGVGSANGRWHYIVSSLISLAEPITKNDPCSILYLEAVHPVLTSARMYQTA